MVRQQVRDWFRNKFSTNRNGGSSADTYQAVFYLGKSNYLIAERKNEAEKY